MRIPSMVGIELHMHAHKVRLPHLKARKKYKQNF